MATNNYFKVKNGLEFPSQDALQVTDTTGPSIRPSLLLDFANTKQLDPRITFSRPTTATYYDGKTVAKAEENLLTYSQEFDNAAWTKTAVTVTANVTTAPDGTATADAMYETTANVVNHAVQASGAFSTAPGTLSIYLKKGDGATAPDWIQLTAGGVPSWSNSAAINTYGIGLGNSTPSSGMGIKFPATQSASSDANTLDDYEEGTWTPTLTRAGQTINQTSYVVM